MTAETREPVAAAVLEHNRAAQDALSAGRVFGPSYQLNGRTLLPVACVSGGGGGGGGAEKSTGEESGSGFGSGFGLNARPVGVYEVTEQGVDWKPTIDVTRLARNGQILAGLIAICVTMLLWRRQS